MPQVAQSPADRLPITDGRSAEARHAARIRAELRQLVGGAPSIAGRLLIDRVVNLALRLHAMDTEPTLLDTHEYIAATQLLADLLAQLGAQPAQPAIVRQPRIAEAAA